MKQHMQQLALAEQTCWLEEELDAQMERCLAQNGNARVAS